MATVNGPNGEINLLKTSAGNPRNKDPWERIATALESVANVAETIADDEIASNERLEARSEIRKVLDYYEGLIFPKEPEPDEEGALEYQYDSGVIHALRFALYPEQGFPPKDTKLIKRLDRS